MAGAGSQAAIATELPLVDLRDFLTPAAPARREAFVADLGAALSALGFVAVTGHGLPPGRLRAAYAAAADLFALPSATKARYERPDEGRQRGYTPFGTEHARDRAQPDLKEFWQIGPDPVGPAAGLPANVFCDEVPTFEAAFGPLFDDLHRFARQLLRAIAAYLGYAPETFDAMATGGNSVLRVIHYPPLDVAPPPGALRAAEHEDINLLTVLPASTEPGLEILDRDGRWLALHTPPDVLICDTGDMMQLITAGRLPSTTHRVVNPGGPNAAAARMSLPFFLHPHPDHVLTPEDPAWGEPVRAHDFLMQRLREIGVA